MVLSVQGKHAIITGGGSGINLAFARLLLSKGCSVLIADLQLRPESQSLLDQFPPPSSSSSSSSSAATPSAPSPSDKPFAAFHKTNVVSWPQLTALWSKALSLFPTVDIVVPGAGIFEPTWSSFWEPPRTDDSNPDSTSRDPADADPGHYSVLDINLTAPIRLSQIAIGHWTRHQEEGCLVHIGSIAGYTYAINTPLYFASKHGLHGFVRSLGGLRDALGIRVGCVAPGGVRTPMWSEDPSKSVLVGENTTFVEPEQIAEAMYELVVNEELGNGTIYECGKAGVRVVPQYHMEPPSGEEMMPGFFAEQKQIFARLKKDGLKV